MNHYFSEMHWLSIMDKFRPKGTGEIISSDPFTTVPFNPFTDLG